jgi:hypothetical protein
VAFPEAGISIIAGFCGTPQRAFPTDFIADVYLRWPAAPRSGQGRCNRQNFPAFSAAGGKVSPPRNLDQVVAGKLNAAAASASSDTRDSVDTAVSE